MSLEESRFLGDRHRAEKRLAIRPFVGWSEG